MSKLESGIVVQEIITENCTPQDKVSPIILLEVLNFQLFYESRTIGHYEKLSKSHIMIYSGV